MRELIERRGCEVLFLSAYSSDFSLIEEAFPKLKALLRREQARTKEALVDAIGRALDAVMPENAKGWFDHYGYAVAQLFWGPLYGALEYLLDWAGEYLPLLKSSLALLPPWGI